MRMERIVVLIMYEAVEALNICITLVSFGFCKSMTVPKCKWKRPLWMTHASATRSLFMWSLDWLGLVVRQLSAPLFLWASLWFSLIIEFCDGWNEGTASALEILFSNRENGHRNSCYTSKTVCGISHQQNTTLWVFTL